ncbi:zinc finger protein 106-like isoform X2 [Carassius auratus]|uniref:Zinc finger protein 106-like isoform X2 n=1 Tax=Carassius auratus TaxID=7957 RepID=A0A6P6LL38_CARAU|nr:zinc finger protein 106-like isoform X2 [Carassius auratus]XP_026085273.1 zinc finger protein 106-like isoform X2 [Carassius auratus]XP_026085274.1 zinc finger protein 106-like isoform X2 [Carassius auratus]
MVKEQKCILCETVYSSKQEMEEHMRSMLHHRELENLKGRDCGHECRVCGVTEVSLTDYASHISSPLHKQRIEDQKNSPTNKDQDEEYFDKDIVQLIEKRKEMIRKEEASAKQAKEEQEECRRWQEFQTQWLGPRPMMYQQCGPWDRPYPNFPQMPKRGRGSNWRNFRFSSPERGKRFHPSRDVRCATWHAQGPPHLQKWESVGHRGGSLHNQGNFWGGRPGGFNVYHPQLRKQLSWNKSQFNDLWNGQYMAPPMLFKSPAKEPQKTPSSSENQTQGEQFLEESGGEHDPNKGKGQKSEKAHRWAPYPQTKLGDPSSQTNPQPPLDKSDVESPQTSKAQSFNVGSQDMERISKADQNNCQYKPTEPEKSCFRNIGSMGSFSYPSTSTIWKPEKPSKLAEDSEMNLKQTGSQNFVGSKGFNHSHSSSEFPQHATSNAEQDLLSEIMRKSKETLLNRNNSDISGTESCLKGSKAVPQINEQVESSELNHNQKLHESKKILNENKCQESLVFVSCFSNEQEQLSSTETSVQIGNVCSDTRPSLQSLQVSTSTMDHEDEEECGEMEENQVMDTLDGGLCSAGEGSHSSPSQQTAGESVPPLSKLALPACLQRDLNRHMGTKGKAASHEPNLNIARRIRNVSGTRKNETEKDSGLKPTLRQLISSSGSRRNVNWDQVYQEVNRKKQGKGLPRFGIEMVPCEPEGPNQMDEGDVPLSEGFHWDSLVEFSQVPSRKRSLSESNVVKDGSAGTSSLPKAVEPVRDSPSRGPTQPPRREELQPKGHLEILGSKGPSKGPEEFEEEGGCLSEPELIDTQGAGKKRRAPGDVVSPEIPNEERKNKRQKIKAKKERSQVDQLLAVSLREEELNKSLQAVDDNLIQARAALQAAYLEVQRLLVLKQQVTTEMNSLRTKRIEILQGMQGEFESKERERNSEDILTSSSTQVSQITAKPVLPTTASHSSSLVSLLPVTIKQEPISQCILIPEPNLVKSPLLAPQSTAPQSTAPAPQSTAPQSTAPAPVQTVFATCQTDTTFSSKMEASRDATSMALTAASSIHRSQPSPVKEIHPNLSSQEGPNPSSSLMSATLSPKPLSPSNHLENNPVKRVRKLKKRKCLNKAKLNEQPEISESELDAVQPATRPTRKCQPHRRSSSTKVPPPTPDEKEEMAVTKVSKTKTQGAKLATPPKNERHSDSSELEMVELPPPDIDIVNLDSSDEEMPEKKAKESASAYTTGHAVKDPQNLACNEVTSTSEIHTSSTVKASESEVKSVSVLESKVPSDISDPGEEEVPTEGEFEGHQEAVNAMQIHNGLLYTCSGDRTIRAFNLISRKCVAVFEGHSSKVNCLLVSCGGGLQQRLYSGSSDQTIRCYNLKTTECVEQLSLPDRVLCLYNRWKILYVGLANGSVVTFSLRNNKQLDVFECHGPRAVSCLATAQEGARRILLVGSYDTTISVRDAKSGLLLRTLEGHSKTVLCMKVVNDLVFSGSSDQSVHAHNIHTGELVRIYKGHSHAVTVVAILGKVMVTACLDKLVRVYELQSHDRLQVYGGHSDMVMCMVIHKSMIYTGCYDGSVRAVRLNLIQNYRCWWYGCTLIFGVMEHLQQHLLNDHTSPAQQTFKCRWRNCDTFFTTRNGSKQAVHGHMQKHAEDDSKMEP